MDLPTILRRIQALLATAARTEGNEIEAALAAERAAELMARYQISAATVTAATPATAPAAEPLVGERVYQDAVRGAKRSAWRMAIVRGVAASTGCHTYWLGAEPALFGRTSAVATARYLCLYLYGEVDRLTAAEARGHGRAYANAYRIGCAQRIAQRLVAAAGDRAAAMRRAAAQGHALPPVPGEAPADAGGGALMVTTAVLAVIDRDRHEVAAAWAKRSAGFTRGPAIGAVSSRDGYMAGREAGNRASLGGNARGALKKSN